MNVAVLASPNDVSVVVAILEALKAIDVPAYGLKIREKWEDLSRAEILRFVDRASHFLIVCSPESGDRRWFAFAAGYGVGKDSRTALYRMDASWEPPRYLNALPILDGLEELSGYYRVEKAEWFVQESRRSARAALLEMGISFHSDSLAQCVKDGDLHAVELFLKAGFLPDARDKHGVPLLCLAARNKHRSVTELLLEFGASIDAQSEDRGYSPLMDAALAGAGEIAELLLAKGAALDLQSKDGQTALVVVVGKNDVAMAKRLLEYGADPDVADKLGLSARKYATLFKNRPMLELFATR